MKDADEQGGDLLSRRRLLSLLVATSATYLIGGSQGLAQTSPTARSLCIVRPEQTEGPYFVDERLHRSDIRSDPTDKQVTPGVPLTIAFQVKRLKAGDCHPLPDAQVDIWHCDARGVYSDVQDPGFDTTGQTFLRGYQLTDAQGTAQFQTIYPGWYPIRTVHIHFKIRTARPVGRVYEFTSQLYFPDDLTDRVHAALPYSSKGRRRVRNHQDFIFQEGGDRLMVQPSEADNGYTATFPITLLMP
ncbi:MAG: intradiol ring-cleavage dioxygenase [Nitrospira sp.]|nr:intradiol ring-cleavage dioxygenase [Nitrospira sp.]